MKLKILPELILADSS